MRHSVNACNKRHRLVATRGQTEMCIGRKLSQSMAKMATLSVQKRLGQPIAKIPTLSVWRLLSGTIRLYFKHKVSLAYFRPDNQHM